MVAQGLAQLRIGTKSLSGFSFKQVGFWFIHPLSFGSPPPLSRLFRPHSSPSTSLPYCAPNSFRWVYYSFIYVMIHFWLSALQICLRIATKYKYCLLLVLLFWCEDRTDTGKDLALGELGEETIERVGDCPDKDYTRKSGHPKSRKSWRDDQDERNQWEEADPSQEDSWEKG